jgi:hypothetical protein
MEESSITRFTVKFIKVKIVVRCTRMREFAKIKH